MDYPITPDDEFRANFLEEKLKKSQGLAQSLADALEVIANHDKRNATSEAAVSIMQEIAIAALANYRNDNS